VAVVDIASLFGPKVRAGAIALLLLSATSVTLPVLSGDGGTVFAQTSDAIDRFMGRSPGERGETDLLKGKARKIADRLLGRPAGDGEPEQRALGKIFDTPPEESLNQLAPAPDPAPFAEPLPAAGTPLGSTGGVPGGTGGGFPGFPGGIVPVVPPGPPVTPIDPPTPPPPPPVPAVPEPGTWALMLIGFGLCGAALRRRKKAETEGTRSAARCASA
jgi:hypothetical protein